MESVQSVLQPLSLSLGVWGRAARLYVLHIWRKSPLASIPMAVIPPLPHSHLFLLCLFICTSSGAFSELPGDRWLSLTVGTCSLQLHTAMAGTAPLLVSPEWKGRGKTHTSIDMTPNWEFDTDLCVMAKAASFSYSFSDWFCLYNDPSQNYHFNIFSTKRKDFLMT